MSYIFFMDESGHDLHNAPYEVRGGIVIDAARLWKFTLDIQKLEISCFGDKSCRPKIELKGAKLLKAKIFENAKLDVPTEDIQRRTIEFLNLGDLSPKNYQFAAYSRSCLKMVEELFKLFQSHNVYVFASMIPREKAKVSKEEKKYLTENGILRKDLVFLWQRYFYFLREHSTNGLLILDETEQNLDSNLLNSTECYFRKTGVGKIRARNIIPIPMFIKSDQNYGIQAADIAIYVLNWGFRSLPGLNADTRKEIEPFAKILENRIYKTGTINSVTLIKEPYAFKKKQISNTDHQ